MPRKEVAGTFGVWGFHAFDQPCGHVDDGVLNFVDADVIAEDRPRVRVRLLYGCAGEPGERRIRQGIAQVAAEAVGHLVGLFFTLPPNPYWLRCASLAKVAERSDLNGFQGNYLSQTAGSFLPRKVRSKCGPQLVCSGECRRLVAQDEINLPLPCRGVCLQVCAYVHDAFLCVLRH